MRQALRCNKPSCRPHRLESVCRSATTGLSRFWRADPHVLHDSILSHARLECTDLGDDYFAFLHSGFSVGARAYMKLVIEVGHGRDNIGQDHGPPGSQDVRYEVGIMTYLLIKVV